MHRKAEITKHAWLRFRARWTDKVPNDYSDELRRLLAEAEEEDLGHATAVRLITNGCQPARYFRTGDWRFVLNEDLTVILTVERAYFQKWNYKQKPQRRRKQRV